MKTCKTCKFWIEYQPEFKLTEAWLYRECTHPKMESEVKVWGSATPPPDGASCHSYDGHGSVFLTGPDFRCIHHTDK